MRYSANDVKELRNTLGVSMDEAKRMLDIQSIDAEIDEYMGEIAVHVSTKDIEAAFDSLSYVIDKLRERDDTIR